MLGSPNHKATGNSVRIQITGYCQNPDLECDLDYWTYEVWEAFPAVDNGQEKLTFTGYLVRGFPSDQKLWFREIVARVMTTIGRGSG